ncbi:MAG: hypothetical protein EAZ62_08115 [Sphingobacteriia bacterium]|nr:MAG: hypothetical protein EAZ62_08115 [Sphingobacteriia bacterium]
MLKKYLSLLGFLSLGPMVVLAQVNDKNRPEKAFVQRIRLDQELNYAKAINLAKEKNWRLELNTPAGKLRLVGVNSMGFPVYEQNYSNAVAAATTRANQLWPGGSSGLSLSGSSAAMRDKLGIWEAESQTPLPGHVEFDGRINQKDNTGSPGLHATHVAGTMVAKGVNPSAKGMAFGIPSLISYDTRSNQSELAAETGLLLSNHSYGIPGGWNFNSTDNRWEFYGRPNENEDFEFGYYSPLSQIMDSIAFNNPNHLMVFSAGNPRNQNGPAVGTNYFRPNAQGTLISAGPRPAGISSNDSYDIITHYGIAKNVLTVGAVTGIPSGYSRPSDVVMSSFSAWGPTDDGRIKPDVVAMGVGLLSSSNATGNSYATLSGTSMSAPNATGSLLLLQEHYQKLVPSNFMRSATLKAIAIHTTDEAGGQAGPDYAFGWGLLNVLKGSQVMSQALASPAPANRESLVLENSLVQGGSFSRTVIASGKGPLVATICWIDPVGPVVPEASYVLNDRSKKLINDLDIRITRAGGASTLPWTLSPDNPSLAAQKGDNTIDNVEKIEIIPLRYHTKEPCKGATKLIPWSSVA